MKKVIFRLMEEMLKHTMFEMEYQHRAKSNPFSEKWISCTRTRTRIQNLKDFLYYHIKIILNAKKPEEFFNHALSQFVHHDYYEFMDLLKNSEKKTEKDPLYRRLYLKLTIDELFVILTMVIMWEHQHYPAVLERELQKEIEEETPIQISDELLQYYIRFMDVLSSKEIISLFDLDALKNTLRLDKEVIEQKPLDRLYLFKDWPDVYDTKFEVRFPEFIKNIQKGTVN